MEYETIGGELKDTDSGRTVLRFLRLGDRFINKSKNGIWEVWGDKCRFNGTAGSSTRACKNLKTGQIEHKLCRMEVFKIPDRPS